MDVEINVEALRTALNKVRHGTARPQPTVGNAERLLQHVLIRYRRTKWDLIAQDGHVRVETRLGLVSGARSHKVACWLVRPGKLNQYLATLPKSDDFTIRAQDYGDKGEDLAFVEENGRFVFEKPEGLDPAEYPKALNLGDYSSAALPKKATRFSIDRAALAGIVSTVKRAAASGPFRPALNGIWLEIMYGDADENGYAVRGVASDGCVLVLCDANEAATGNGSVSKESGKKPDDVAKTIFLTYRLFSNSLFAELVKPQARVENTAFDVINIANFGPPGRVVIDDNQDTTVYVDEDYSGKFLPYRDMQPMKLYGLKTPHARFRRDEWARALRKLSIFADSKNPMMRLELLTTDTGGGTLSIVNASGNAVKLTETETTFKKHPFVSVYNPKYIKTCLNAFKRGAWLEVYGGNPLDQPLVLRDAQVVDGFRAFAMVMPIHHKEE